MIIIRTIWTRQRSSIRPQKKNKNKTSAVQTKHYLWAKLKMCWALARNSIIILILRQKIPQSGLVLASTVHLPADAMWIPPWLISNSKWYNNQILSRKSPSDNNVHLTSSARHQGSRVNSTALWRKFRMISSRWRWLGTALTQAWNSTSSLPPYSTKSTSVKLKRWARSIAATTKMPRTVSMRR